MPHTPSLRAGACVALLRRTSDGLELLTVTRPVGGKRCMPGGKREPDEDAVTNAVRETFEETGVSVAPQALQRLFSGPCPSAEAPSHWVDVLWAWWDDAWGTPVACEPTVLPAWVAVDAYLSVSAFPQFDASVIALLHNATGAEAKT